MPIQSMENESRILKADVFVGRCEPSYGAAGFDADTPARRAMKAIWAAMGRDPDNPFREQLSPGKCAVVKPNWVMHYNRSKGGLDCLVTHPSIIGWMIQWCAKAMEGQGRIVVGDAPLQACDFAALMQETKLADLAAAVRRRYPGLELVFQDWRLTIFQRGGFGSMGSQTQQGLQSGFDG